MIDHYMQIDKEATGKNIKRLMAEKGISVSEVSNFLSLSCKQTVYRWLRGETFPNTENGINLALLLGVTIDNIYIVK